MSGIIPPKGFAFPVRINSPLDEPISIAISNLIESGYVEERRKYYWETLSQCKGMAQSAEGSKSFFI